MLALPCRFAIVLLLGLVGSKQAPAQNRLAIAFTPVESKHFTTHMLRALLLVDTLQQFRGNSGITFSIQLRNDSSAAVAIRNPLDFLVLRLETSSQPGFNLA
jgi:hypothetical protein